MNSLPRIVLISMVLAVLGLCACGEKRSLVGSWQAESNGVKTAVQFTEAGQFHITLDESQLVVSGTYELQGDTLTLSLDPRQFGEPKSNPPPLKYEVKWLKDSFVLETKENVANLLPGLAGATFKRAEGAGTPPFGKHAELTAADRCRDNLQQIASAMLLYANDYDGYLPNAGEWTDLVAPYIKNRHVINCPAIGTGYGYAMNESLSSANIRGIPNPSTVPLVYDSAALELDANDAVTSLPAPARHDDVNYIAYLDGHVNGVPAR